MKNATTLFLLLWLLAGACSAPKSTSAVDDPLLDKKLDLREVVIQAAADANRGMTVPVDLVFIIDKSIVPTLQGFTASGWFSVRDTGLGDWDKKTVILSLEIRPGEQRRLDPEDFPAGASGAVGIVIFAGYSNPGLHRAGATDARRLLIDLQAITFNLSGER